MARPNRFHENPELDYGWLARLWPVAILFHLAGNSYFLAALFQGTTNTIGAAQVLVAIACLMVLARPRPTTGILLAISFLTVTWLKAPRIGNHEVLLALVSLALLISAVVFDEQWLKRSASGLRWIFVIAYSAMAISKLNTGFFSEQSSCAVLFGDELGRWIGVEPSASSLLSRTSIVVAAVVELTIPVLLIVRRYRNLGVVVGLVFHTGLALDPVAHVFDFTSVLIPMFLLFSAGEVQVDLQATLDRLAAPFRGSGVAVMAALAVGLEATILSLGGEQWWLPFPVWLLYATGTISLVVSRLLANLRGSGDLGGDRVGLRFAIVLFPVVALTVMNALSPYLTVRTAAGFNMYSNLETMVAEPNHLVLSGTTTARTTELFEVVETPEDHALAYYVDSGLGVPSENLQRFRYQHGSEGDGLVLLRPLVSPTDDLVTLEEMPAPPSGWQGLLAYKLAYRRSADLHTPARGLREWGPIG